MTLLIANKSVEENLKMKIWLINSSEPTPIDEGQVRLLRMGILARYLVNRGHQVLWWNADFLHATKKHRFGTDKTIEIEPHYTIHFIHGPGYTKHISLVRFWDHRIIAQKFLKEAEKTEKPDVILCSLPTLDLADVATKYGKKNNIPVILDIRDLWPDIFIEKTSLLLKPFVSLAIISLHFTAIRSCQNAFAITGNTPKFVEWGLKKVKRSQTEFDKYFPFGYEEPEISVLEKEEIDHFWQSKGVKLDIYSHVITYIGTIGQNFQEEIVVHAIKKILKKYNVLFVFCGGGDRLEELRLKHRGNPNIIFPGWVDAKQIWRLMNHATIALASYKESENYRSSLTNKMIEYMAGELPILFSIDEGYVANLIQTNEIGLTYGGSSERLSESILRLLDDEPFRIKLAQNSRRLFEQNFKADKVYKDFVSYLEKIVSIQGDKE
jgi:glycosyltransferase involved in cell wall biosynthesis